jgi:predicted DNA-binding transcriptional regulator AlpA
MKETNGAKERVEDIKSLSHDRGLGSVRTLHRWNSSGLLPQPIRLGGRLLFRSRDIDLWISLGCPSRQEFKARKEASNAI